MNMDGVHCECEREPIFRGRHDQTPCPVHGQKGKAAWDRLEAAASTLQAAEAERDEAMSETARIQRAAFDALERIADLEHALIAAAWPIHAMSDTHPDLPEWAREPIKWLRELIEDREAAEARESALREGLRKIASYNAEELESESWGEQNAADMVRIAEATLKRIEGQTSLIGDGPKTDNHPDPPAGRGSGVDVPGDAEFPRHRGDDPGPAADPSSRASSVGEGASGARALTEPQPPCTHCGGRGVEPTPALLSTQEPTR